MNYQETLEFLASHDMTMSRYERYDWDRFVKKIGLKINFPFIHITGTNGKGSTAKFIYEIYRAQGYKAAIFGKPYFYKMNELVSFDGGEISDEDIASIVTKYQKVIEQYDLSRFEVEVLVSFEWLNQCKPDIAIIECGMGGHTDATNLETNRPVLSIITTVSLEHTAFLGSTVTEIAMSKSGIIKNYGSVLVGKLSNDAMTTIRNDAKRKTADIYIVDDYHHEQHNNGQIAFDYGPNNYVINSSAKYMVNNAAMAIEAVTILQETFPVSLESIKKGLLAKTLPGRMERFGNVILDGAHCPEAIDKLMESVSLINRGKGVHVLFASYRDKNIAIELPRIDKDATDLTLTTFDSARARDEMDYFLYLADYKYEQDYKMAINNLREQFPDDIILVTGSLAFVGIVRKYLLETSHE